MKNKKRMKTEDKAEADEDGVEEEEETEADKEEKEEKIGEEDVKENERIARFSHRELLEIMNINDEFLEETNLTLTFRMTGQYFFIHLLNHAPS
ncbi:hypothetical protein M8J77_006615 [Diaphorina citri]|nr:hypothetical protein M8J77_006615 [Diaphorina citri]